MKRSKTEIIADLTLINNYFRRLAETNPSAQPEFDACNKIISIIDRDGFSKRDLVEVVQIFNQVTEQKHYNGSGWHDFEFKIFGLLHEFGVESTWKGDQIEIKEKQ